MAKHQPVSGSRNQHALGNPTQGTGKHGTGSSHQSGSAQQPASKATGKGGSR
jgi:hypothetical protein